jgi:hypothetical protein
LDALDGDEKGVPEVEPDPLRAQTLCGQRGPAMIGFNAVRNGHDPDASVDDPLRGPSVWRFMLSTAHWRDRTGKTAWESEKQDHE